jgi:tetratricopeptide (TPR) repeat protein
MPQRRPRILSLLLVLWLAAQWQGCAALRSEWYREETRGLYREGCERYGAGEVDAAEAIFRRVVALDPGYAEAYLVLGQIALVRGRPETAEDLFRRALETDGGLAGAVRPLLLRSRQAASRQAREAADLTLAGVLSLFTTGDEAAIETAFASARGLDATAMDPASVSPAERSRLVLLVAGRLYSGRASPAENYFAGRFLAFNGGHDALAARALETWIEETGAATPELWCLVAELHARSGHPAGALACLRRAADRSGRFDPALCRAVERLTGLPCEDLSACESRPDGRGGTGRREEPSPEVWFTLSESR